MTTPFQEPPLNEAAAKITQDEPSPLPTRKKLQLKPRSVQPLSPRPRQRSLSSKGDLFGKAKPREMVLAERGVDPKTLDARIERKASTHFTSSQQAELDAVRQQLEALDLKWRDANESELPEEEHRLAAETKRAELQKLMKSFEDANAKNVKKVDEHQSPVSTLPEMPFTTIPSRHRGSARRVHTAKPMPQHDEEPDDNVFANFGSNRRRREKGTALT